MHQILDFEDVSCSNVSTAYYQNLNKLFDRMLNDI